MGGKMSRDKGQRGEREVIKLLQPIVDEVYTKWNMEPPSLERNLMQSHKGGCDLAGLGWLALEVKHQESSNLKSWWEQTKSQANGREPILIHRKNHGRWRIRMIGYLVVKDGARVRAPVDIALEAFLAYFRIRIEKELIS